MCNLKKIACGAAGIHIHIESAPIIMNLHRAQGSIVEVTGRYPYTLFRFKLNMHQPYECAQSTRDLSRGHGEVPVYPVQIQIEYAPAIMNVHRVHGSSVEVTGRFPYTLFRFKLNMP